MKITRYNTICTLPKVAKLEEIEIKDREGFDESVADFTAFVPTEDSVRSLPVGDIGKEFFDFPDGKDTGERVPLARKRGVDIAELSTAIKEQQQEIKYVVGEIKAEVDHQNFLDGVNNAPKSSAEPSGSSAKTE